MNAGPDGRPRFWPYFATGVTIVLVAAVLTAVLDKSWFQDRLKWTNLDSLFLLSLPKPSPDVILVEIDENDYHDNELFKGTSPLDPRVVRKLIQAIEDAGARAIGVDLLTGQWDSTDVQGLNPQKLVWALDGEIGNNDKWHLEPIERGERGGHVFAPPALDVVDGQVREYWREPLVDDERGSVKSFMTKLLLKYDPKGDFEPSTKPGELEYIDYVAPRSHLDITAAGSVLRSATWPAWKENGRMNGKVVLLGGAFKEARDNYKTPLGEMYGVEILANILSSEMRSPRLREASNMETTIADILFGLAIVWVSYFPPRPWNVVAVPLGAIVAAVAMSVVLFSVWRHYLSFMPILVGTIIHASIEHFYEYRNIVVELEELKESARARRSSRDEAEPPNETGDSRRAVESNISH